MTKKIYKDLFCAPDNGLQHFKNMEQRAGRSGFAQLMISTSGTKITPYSMFSEHCGKIIWCTKYAFTFLVTLFKGVDAPQADLLET